MNYPLGELCISGSRSCGGQYGRERLSERGAFYGQRYSSAQQTNAHCQTEEALKHPEYATVQARLSSFNGWDVSWLEVEDMADAGFYYTGIKDYVICFSCGKGIKDWDHGDSPWIEHGRWSSHCSYLMQCLGEDLVCLCQRTDLEDEDIRDQLSRRLSELRIRRLEDRVIEDLNSKAAHLVLEMGYSQSDVVDAVRFARNKYGSGELKGSQLLEYLLDNCESEKQKREKEAQMRTQQERIRQAERMKRLEDNASVEEPKSDQHRVLYENRRLREERLCKICLEEEACVVFVPCGHLVSCKQCSQRLQNCAICRARIRERVQTYLA